MERPDPLQPEPPRRVSLEALLTWGFGSLIASGVLAALLAFGVWRLTAAAFSEYERQDAPITLQASNGVDAWLEVGRQAELFILTSDTAEGMGASRPHVTAWQSSLTSLHTYIARIRDTADDSDQAVRDLLPELEAALTQYETDFLVIVNQTEFLRNETTGLDAALDATVEQLDELLGADALPALDASFLRLNDIEMNFMQTHDASLLDAFTVEISRFRDLSSSSPAQASLDLIQRYQELFSQYAAAERELDARKLDFMNATARIEAALELIEEAALANGHATLQALERGVSGVALASAVMALVIALAGAAIAVMVSGRIRLAAQRVIGFAARVAAGRLDTRIHQVDTGKFGALELALNTMADRLQENDQQMNQQARLLERGNRRIALLSELTSMLQSAMSSAEAINIIASHLSRMELANGGTLYLFNEEKSQLEPIAKWGSTRAEANIAAQDCWAFRLGQTYGSVEGAAIACKHVDYPEADPLYLCLPLVTQGGILGLVHLHFTEGAAREFEEEARFARRLAEQLGLALANLKLREALHSQSITDALTGLFNRRFLEETLTREIARAAREHSQVAVLMIDADHFKRYNDTHGHDAGDAALRQLAKALKNNCRISDTACRYGGEEFTVVLPATSAVGAATWATRLLAAVRQIQPSLNGKSLPGLTVSIGIAVYPEHGGNAEATLKQADLALYEAKRTGRDRLVIHGSGE